MTNEMKLLRAFIEAQGYEIETTEDIKTVYRRVDIMGNGEIKENAMPESIIRTTDYKVTKTPYNKRPMLHRIVRSYEKGEISHDEMVARIIERGE